MQAPLAVAILVFLCAVPAATAHGAPLPPSYMTRLLHDYNDDWQGPDGHSAVHDGHDLIALDVQEAYNETLGKNVLVFWLGMDHGWDADPVKPELKDVITFRAKGQAVSREFRTSDNQRFQGTFEAIIGPKPMLLNTGAQDGLRFFIGGMIKLESLGLVAGDKISDFSVQGYAGASKADHMVGGYTIGGQTTDQEPPSENCDGEGCHQAYRRSEYQLRGPVMYVRSEVDKAKATVRPGDNVTVTWVITNIAGVSQTVTITSAAPAGIKAGMHGPGYSESRLSFKLEPGVSATIHVYLTASGGASSGPVDVTLTTSLGGRMTNRVDVTSALPATSTGGSSHGAPGAKGSPGPDSALALAALAASVAVAGTRRRR